MTSTPRPFFRTVLLIFFLSCRFALAEDRPETGKKIPEFVPLDDVIHSFIDRTGCQAGTLAISRDGQLLYSRGYGWSDEGMLKRVPPDALMRIASITKPITAAAVKNSIRAKKLPLSAKAFELISAPESKIADSRIHGITVAHLLEHQGGWDRDQSFDPMFQTKRIETELNLRSPASPQDVIEFMLTQPLQFSPGQKTVYSNFGYCVLGRVLEKVMNMPYSECIQKSVCSPHGIKDISLGHSVLKTRAAREVWYPVGENAFSLEVMDAHGGLIASAPALCQFLDSYWINGEPRLRGQRGNWTFFGSLPGTTAMVRQRQDGFNVAVLFNGRRETNYNEDNNWLKMKIDQALERLGKGK